MVTVSLLSTGALRKVPKRGGWGTTREAQNLPTTSLGKKTMAVSEARAKWAVGPLEPATRREGPPRPAPGHGHQHVSLPGQTMFISRARLGDGSRWGSVETTCSHVLPVSCPRPFLRNRAPFSPNGEPACMADGPRSGKGGKVNSEMNASSEPAPLCPCHFPRSVPQETKHTRA